MAGLAGARAGDRADVDDERSSAHSASKASRPSEPALFVTFLDAALGSARDHMLARLFAAIIAINAAAGQVSRAACTPPGHTPGRLALRFVVWL